jgi:hypothetical protein
MHNKSIIAQNYTNGQFMKVKGIDEAKVIMLYNVIMLPV